MGKGFYIKLAWTNVSRNKRVCLPYFITTVIISGVYLMIAALMFSGGLDNIPSGRTAQGIFTIGMVMFSIFSFFFMTYINNYLIMQRKKEFGLYGVLGLSKRHVGRVIFYENLIILGAGILCGILFALVFGNLLFLLLLKLIHAAGGTRFVIAPLAFGLMLGMFLIIFITNFIYNSVKIRLANPIELMQSQKKGDKKSRILVPMTLFGLAGLGLSYYYAWTTASPAQALGLFFLLASLVIFATQALFTSGSIVFLKMLRANKRIYYKLKNFIAISGMFHRMRQNARGLATICILSTMLIVTVSTTLALYLGQEKMLTGMYPYNVEVHLKDASESEVKAYVERLNAVSSEYNVSLSADQNKLVYINDFKTVEMIRNNMINSKSNVQNYGNAIWHDKSIVFDVKGDEAKCSEFLKEAKKEYPQFFKKSPGFLISDAFSARQDCYGMYGGLLFLGAFFGMLFLTVTVLIIYFKQITEGYEDKEQFNILEKVGMDNKQVKSTINRQVLWVFFIPLGMTLLHMVFASKIMARMLQTFMLYDWVLVLSCIGGVCAVFVLIYLVVYRLTTKVYYNIVKW